ncbi:MAG: hypothetical protein M3044_13260 [Thermoproteota archaeon]|nr:hypothetical protein [Thermoproteota archaeon]
MELLICKVVFEDKKERSVCFNNFIVLDDGYWHRPMDCTTRYAIYQYRFRANRRGRKGIAALIRSVTQDVAISNKRPCLEYGDTFVRKDSHKERGGEFREFTYLLEIKNETQNSQAEDCRSTIDLSSIGVSPFYGMWEISDEVAIPISHRELIQLFTKSEFSDGTPTRTSTIFPEIEKWYNDHRKISGFRIVKKAIKDLHTIK